MCCFGDFRPRTVLGQEKSFPDGSSDHPLPEASVTPRGLWSQKPLRGWFLGPGSLNMGYSDPLALMIYEAW